MHTAHIRETTLDALGAAQICVSGKKVQLSTVDGRRWSFHIDHVAVQATADADEVRLDVPGDVIVLRPDNPERFRWEFIPHLRTARSRWSNRRRRR